MFEATMATCTRGRPHSPAIRCPKTLCHYCCESIRASSSSSPSFDCSAAIPSRRCSATYSTRSSRPFVWWWPTRYHRRLLPGWAGDGEWLLSLLRSLERRRLFRSLLAHSFSLPFSVEAIWNWSWHSGLSESYTFNSNNCLFFHAKSFWALFARKCFLIHTLKHFLSSLRNEWNVSGFKAVSLHPSSSSRSESPGSSYQPNRYYRSWTPSPYRPVSFDWSSDRLRQSSADPLIDLCYRCCYCLYHYSS